MDGICATCYAGLRGESLPVGTVIGRQAVEEFAAAMQTYRSRVSSTHGKPIELRWPLLPDDSGRPSADVRTIEPADGATCLADLLEARSPDDPALQSEADGQVELGAKRNGRRLVTIVQWRKSDFQHEPFRDAREYRVPAERRLLVAHGDHVKIGTVLTDGWPDPHDILRIYGERALALWLLEQASSILASADVPLPGFSFELLVRQMLSRVTIQARNDSDMDEGEIVTKEHFDRTNDQLFAEGHRPAYASYTLLGISRLT